jgi:hypothetical protein
MKPTQDELLYLAKPLSAAEETVEEITKSPQADGHSAIRTMKFIVEAIERLDEERQEP